MASQKPPRRSSKADTVFEPYQRALRNFWEGRPKTAIEELTAALSSDLKMDDACTLYRLWIEILASSGDTPSLRILQDHITHQAKLSHRHSLPLYALSGLIYFCLDKIDAAHLLLKSLTPKAKKLNAKNLYAAELKLLLSERVGGDDSKLLLGDLAQIKDYYQLTTLSRSLWLTGKESGQKRVLSRIRRLFAESPWPDFFALHTLYAAGDYAEALAPAKKLVQKFPGNERYRFQLGEINYRNGNLDKALVDFKKLDQFYNQTDPEILHYLGLITGKLGHDATEYLAKAALAYQDQGIPADNLSRWCLMDTNPTQDETKPFRVWLYIPKVRESLALQSEPEQEIREIRRSFQHNVAAGDLIVVLAKSQIAATTYRLVAFYQMDGDAVWHPLLGSVSYLKLVQRLSYPARIDDEQLVGQLEARKNTKLFEQCQLIAADQSIFDSLLQTVEDELETKGFELEQVLAKTKPISA